jgi:hypothetical protein
VKNDNYFFVHLSTFPSNLSLAPTQPPVQWVPGGLSLVVQRLGREADHPPPSSFEVNEWRYTSTPQYAFTAWCSAEARGQLYLYVGGSFRTESITKHASNTHSLRSNTTGYGDKTHQIAIQLHLVAESCTVCSSRSRWPVRKLLDAPSYIKHFITTGILKNNQLHTFCYAYGYIIDMHLIIL